VIVAGARILDAKDILLCAPTGKAAKRLEETTKIKAQTIHRLLGAKHDPTTDGTVFDRSAKNPLPSGCIVLVDEASMIDIPTMRGLVEAMPKDGRLILVGDRNQLPSVDAGAVLGDLINAKNSRGELFVPSTELVNVYRQSRNSSIAKGAAEIRQGRLPIMSRQPVGGLVFYEEAQDNLVKSILAFVKNVCIDKLKLNPHQFAILCPQTKGTAGTWQLNRELSNILNPKGRQIPGVFRAADDDVEMPIQRVGDRVMLKENDNENDIMNGEIGTIIDAGIMKLKGADRQCMVIRFGDAKAPDSFRDVIYPAAFWRNFILAYAITIHKSQGSQFYTVIMPQTMAHSSMLDRSLLYTGWTRATDLLCIFGETEALELAVSCTDASARNTRLPAYIHDKATEAGLRGRPAPPEPARKPPVAETPRPVTPVAPAPRPSTASAPAHRPASPASRPVPGRGRPPSFSHSNQAATSPSSEPSAARPSKPRGRPASFKPPVDEDTTPDAPSM
jgi:exodeoxyribonuclease V alpha subunit